MIARTERCVDAGCQQSGPINPARVPSGLSRIANHYWANEKVTSLFQARRVKWSINGIFYKFCAIVKLYDGGLPSLIAPVSLRYRFLLAWHRGTPGETLHIRFSFRSIPTLLSDFRSVLVEEEGNRGAGKCKKSRDARCPMDTQISVHVRGEQRENEPKGRSEQTVSGEHGSGVDSVRVHQVIQDWHVHRHHAKAKWHARCDRGHPVDGWRVRPSKPEKTNRKSDTPDESRRETSLRG